jgi:hypothetical protein
MKVLGRALRLGVVALLFLTLTASYSDAGGRRSGGGGGRMHSGGGGHHHHGGSHGHGRVIVGVGPWWGPGSWGGYYGYYPYYPYYSYYPYYPYYPYSQPVTAPTTYIERQLETGSPPEAYWYYCQSARAYYPAVQSCPESWLRVAPKDQ